MKLVTEGEIKESKEGGYDFKLYGPFIFYQLGGGVVLGIFLGLQSFRGGSDKFHGDTTKNSPTHPPPSPK